MNIESQEQPKDIIVRKGLFREKVNLNQVTHIVMENLRAHYWVGDQMIYQCQFSIKEQELTEKVFAQPSCQYIEIKPYENSEVVEPQNQEACLQGETARVKKAVDKYNAKTGLHVEYEIAYCEEVQTYLFYFYEKTLHDSWLFRCGPISECVRHKDPAKCVRVKNEGWIWHLENYLGEVTKMVKIKTREKKHV